MMPNMPDPAAMQREMLMKLMAEQSMVGQGAMAPPMPPQTPITPPGPGTAPQPFLPPQPPSGRRRGA